jgi:acetyl-CoA carboxylase biotin carboxyl carrier protein
MEVKQINQLMLAMGRYGIRQLSIKKEGFELSLEKEEQSFDRSYEALPEEIEENPLRSDFVKRRVQSVGHGSDELGNTEALTKEELAGIYIESPMVGTIYLSPGPDESSFVTVGDRVSEDTVVCIVEAMKVMNEIRAGAKGVVEEILIDNAHPVEFGTKLFRIVAK